MYIFICIGSTKLVGDSLGPMIGSYLKKKFKNNDIIKVYGDLNNQIDFYNIEFALKEIEKQYSNKCTKIIIDSGLGRNIGSFLVSKGEIYLGKGLNKNKKINGDISIIGIVGENHGNTLKNFLELKSLEKNRINQMAIEIVRAINID